jgi:hypothetical protein
VAEIYVYEIESQYLRVMEQVSPYSSRGVAAEGRHHGATPIARPLPRPSTSAAGRAPPLLIGAW